jgi:hypothetical protein
MTKMKELESVLLQGHRDADPVIIQDEEGSGHT